MANVETTVFTCGTILNSATNASSYSGILIADLGIGATSVPAYGNDNIPQPTQVGGNNVSACLEIQSTDGAFLLPRMTTVQRDAIAVPSNGMMIYNTTTNTINAYENGAWGAGGGGDVSGPGGSTNDALAVFDGVTGTLIQNTSVLLNPITSIFSAVGGIINAAGSAATPTYSFTGDTNTGIYQSGADEIAISGGGHPVAFFQGATTNVNSLTFFSANTGLGPFIVAAGEANVSLNLATSGTGFFSFLTNLADEQVSISATAAAVNRIDLTGAATTASPTISTVGADATIPLVITPKNNAGVLFNAGAAGAPGIAFNGGAASKASGLSLTIGGGAATTYLGLSVNTAIRAALNQNGVISLGTTTFDTTTTNALAIAAGTAPTGVANVLQLYGATIGGNTGTVGLRIPAGSLTASVDNVVTNKVQVEINGTTYYLLATTSAA